MTLALYMYTACVNNFFELFWIFSRIIFVPNRHDHYLKYKLLMIVYDLGSDNDVGLDGNDMILFMNLSR